MLVEVVISPNDAGQRAERYLRRYLPQLSTGRLQSLFRRKEIKVGKKPVEQGYLLQAGDTLRVFGVRDEEAASHDALRASEPDSGASPAAGRAGKTARASYPPPDIVYEDFELLVVDKAAGVAAHPGSGILPGASLIERARAYLSSDEGREQSKRQRTRAAEGKPEDAPLEDLLFSGSREGLEPGWGNELFSPSLIHRLDKDTSGLLLIAKTGSRLRELTAALREGLIRKRYLALVAGRPATASGTIDAALDRDDAPSGAKSRIVDEGEGKRSVTHYKTLKTLSVRGAEYSLLQVTIDTGRMHQIRAHLAHIGHPIVGDTRYDKPSAARERLKELGLKRLFLHAEELSWVDNGAKRVFKAPLPDELRAVAGKT
jgi:23S rRNA pseudouridine955/2504/2580 synthase